MIIKRGGHIFGEIYKLRKGLWTNFLDCVFRVLIGWAGKLRSRGVLATVGLEVQIIRLEK